MKKVVQKIYKVAEDRLGADTGKIITVILFGILLLVVVIPADGCSEDTEKKEGYETDATDDGYLTGLFSSEIKDAATENVSNEAEDFSNEEEYYEARLKEILETSYGKGSIEVMVHIIRDEEKGLYGDLSEECVIDGVLVVADVEAANDILTISEAVCSLFNLPACKVYVIKKS